MAQCEIPWSRPRPVPINSANIERMCPEFTEQPEMVERAQEMGVLPLDATVTDIWRDGDRVVISYH